MSLDPHEIGARLQRGAQMETRAISLLSEHLPTAAWVAWSGGKDSTVTAHIADRVQPGIPIVHFDCGLDFPENTAYMGEVAARFGWNHHVIRVGDGLAEMIKGGTWDWAAEIADNDWWFVAVEGPAQEARRRFGDVRLWGLRCDESRSRQAALASTRGVRRLANGETSIAPIWNWKRTDVFSYHRRHRIPPNPIYKRLAELGVPEESQRVSNVVGSDGMRHGRLVWLRRGWPDLWARLQLLLPRIREMG